MEGILRTQRMMWISQIIWLKKTFEYVARVPEALLLNASIFRSQRIDRMKPDVALALTGARPKSPPTILINFQRRTEQAFLRHMLCSNWQSDKSKQRPAIKVKATRRANRTIAACSGQITTTRHRLNGSDCSTHRGKPRERRGWTLEQGHLYHLAIFELYSSCDKTSRRLNLKTKTNYTRPSLL